MGHRGHIPHIGGDLQGGVHIVLVQLGDHGVVLDLDQRLRGQVDIAENAAVVDHILILEPGAVAELVDLDRQQVLALHQIIGDVKAVGRVAVLAVAHFLTVQVDVVSGLHALEAQIDAAVVGAHLLGDLEGVAVQTHGVIVGGGPGHGNIPVVLALPGHGGIGIDGEVKVLTVSGPAQGEPDLLPAVGLIGDEALGHEAVLAHKGRGQSVILHNGQLPGLLLAGQELEVDGVFAGVVIPHGLGCGSCILIGDPGNGCILPVDAEDILGVHLVAVHVGVGGAGPLLVGELDLVHLIAALDHLSDDHVFFKVHPEDHILVGGGVFAGELLGGQGLVIDHDLLEQQALVIAAGGGVVAHTEGIAGIVDGSGDLVVGVGNCAVDDDGQSGAGIGHSHIVPLVGEGSIDLITVAVEPVAAVADEGHDAGVLDPEAQGVVADGGDHVVGLIDGVGRDVDPGGNGEFLAAGHGLGDDHLRIVHREGALHRPAVLGFAGDHDGTAAQLGIQIVGAQVVNEYLLDDGGADGSRLQTQGGGSLCGQCGEATCGQKPAQDHDHRYQHGYCSFLHTFFLHSQCDRVVCRTAPLTSRFFVYDCIIYHYITKSHCDFQHFLVIISLYPFKCGTSVRHPGQFYPTIFVQPPPI